VDNVIWIPIEQIEANDYNPNVVPSLELNLLYKSIKADGYTQPIVTYRDAERDKYVIVDGFHRYLVSKMYPEILANNQGMLPIVVIEKDINDRMASTIRHNRARGRHVVDGMVGLVYHLLENGWDDVRICDELGMQADELVRIKYISGYAKLYENMEYSRSWVPAVKVKPKFTKGDKENPDERLFKYAKKAENNTKTD
jgi:ParB-like chromosome segregation protein Spo0J